MLTISSSYCSDTFLNEERKILQRLSSDPINYPVKIVRENSAKIFTRPLYKNLVTIYDYITRGSEQENKRIIRKTTLINPVKPSSVSSSELYQNKLQENINVDEIFSKNIRCSQCKIRAKFLFCFSIYHLTEQITVITNIWLKTFLNAALGLKT